jgi:hypothetical protein
MTPFLLAQLVPPTPVPSSLFPESLFTLPVLTALGVLVTGIIAALASGIVLIINSLHSVAKDTAVVLGHVNSEKSLAEGRENTLKRENELLREMLADKKATAALLAQAATHARAERTARASDATPLPVEVVNTPLAVVTDGPPPSNGLKLTREEL